MDNRENHVVKKLYMIGGTMGVGKTAVCQQLKKQLPDNWNYKIVMYAVSLLWLTHRICKEDWRNFYEKNTAGAVVERFSAVRLRCEGRW